MVLRISAFLLLAGCAAAAPQRQPQLAAGNGLVALVYGEGPRVFLRTAPDSGTAFGAPVQVADITGLMLGRYRGPRVAVAGKTLLVSAIGASGDLALYRSNDQGRTWTPRIVNDVPGAAREGLHALAADAKGRAILVWLDLRKPGTRIEGAYSSDAGATWSSNFLVYESPGGSVCECCHPSAVFDEGGAAWVMWRNQLTGSRDMYLARAGDRVHYEPPVKLGTGTWKLDACPMDGGSVAVSGRRIVTAWRREDAVYLAEPGQPETRLGEGHDPVVVARGTGSVAVWTSRTGIVSWKTGDTVPSELSANGAFPALVGLPGGAVLAAWELNGAIELRRLP